MATAFEEPGGDDNGVPENIDGDSADSDLVDLDGPDATGKILRDKVYDANKVPPQDVVVDANSGKAVVLVTMTEGEEHSVCIIKVLLPRCGGELFSPDMPGEYENDYVDTRRRAVWKLSHTPPYWIYVRERESLQHDLHEWWVHVLDVHFPGGRVPTINVLTQGTPFGDVQETGDMRARSKTAETQQYAVSSAVQLWISRLQQMMRGVFGYFNS